MEPLPQSIARGNDGGQMRAWWLTRMLYGPPRYGLRGKISNGYFFTGSAGR
jgi:hypothetical protein